jgi:hypothetical protein
VILRALAIMNWKNLSLNLMQDRQQRCRAAGR